MYMNKITFRKERYQKLRGISKLLHRELIFTIEIITVQRKGIEDIHFPTLSPSTPTLTLRNQRS